MEEEEGVGWRVARELPRDLEVQTLATLTVPGSSHGGDQSSEKTCWKKAVVIKIKACSKIP